MPYQLYVFHVLLCEQIILIHNVELELKYVMILYAEFPSCYDDENAKL
jgi:hypothetical protein